MLKREIKEASNETLILKLGRMMTSFRVHKGEIKDGQAISEELERRGVIESAEAFFAERERQYRA